MYIHFASQPSHCKFSSQPLSSHNAHQLSFTINSMQIHLTVTFTSQCASTSLHNHLIINSVHRLANVHNHIILNLVHSHITRYIHLASQPSHYKFSSQPLSRGSEHLLNFTKISLQIQFTTTPTSLSFTTNNLIINSVYNHCH